MLREMAHHACENQCERLSPEYESGWSEEENPYIDDDWGEQEEEQKEEEAEEEEQVEEEEEDLQYSGYGSENWFGATNYSPSVLCGVQQVEDTSKRGEGQGPEQAQLRGNPF